MNEVHQRIMASIRPLLQRADRFIWELKNPRKTPGVHDPQHEKFHRYQVLINPVTGELWLEPIPPSEWWKPAYCHRLQIEFYAELSGDQ